MTDQQDLLLLKQSADHTVRQLLEVLHRTPTLSAELKGLVAADDIVQEFTTLVLQKPKAAEQLLRMSFATLINLHTSDEIARQLTE